MTFAFGLLNYAVRLLHSLLIFTLPINFPLWRNLSQMRPRYFNDFTECFDVLCHFESRYSLITQRHKDTKTVEVIYGSSIHDLYITQMVFEKVLLLDWMASSNSALPTNHLTNCSTQMSFHMILTSLELTRTNHRKNFRISVNFLSPLPWYNHTISSWCLFFPILTTSIATHLIYRREEKIYYSDGAQCDSETHLMSGVESGVVRAENGASGSGSDVAQQGPPSPSRLNNAIHRFFTHKKIKVLISVAVLL